MFCHGVASSSEGAGLNLSTNVFIAHYRIASFVNAMTASREDSYAFDTGTDVITPSIYGDATSASTGYALLGRVLFSPEVTVTQRMAGSGIAPKVHGMIPSGADMMSRTDGPWLVIVEPGFSKQQTVRKIVPGWTSPLISSADYVLVSAHY